MRKVRCRFQPVPLVLVFSESAAQALVVFVTEGTMGLLMDWEKSNRRCRPQPVALELVFSDILARFDNLFLYHRVGTDQSFAHI